MRLFAKPCTPPTEVGLWGDIFCIHWLSNWLKIQICVWSTTVGKKYLHYNKSLQSERYYLLFHDANPRSGHFEPLLRLENKHAKYQQNT